MNYLRFISSIFGACVACTGIIVAHRPLNFDPASVAPVTTAVGADDYDFAYRRVASGWELWFTHSLGSGDRILMTVAAGAPLSAAASSPLNQTPPSGARPHALMDGAVAFPHCGCCDSCAAVNDGVMVSNRPDAAGRYHGNDLYEIHWDGHQWSTFRIDIVNSDDWDDTPALNADGTILYFSSTRRDPQRGGTDLFMSRRVGGGWGEPAMLDISDPDVHEQSPEVGPDGWLYYASDRNGDFDIWRVQLGPKGMPIEGTAEVVEAANKRGSEELHPLFNACRRFMMFSSNRDGQSYKTYWVTTKDGEPALTIHVVSMQSHPTLEGRVHSMIPVARCAVVVNGKEYFTDDYGDVVPPTPLIGCGLWPPMPAAVSYTVEALPQGTSLVSPQETLIVQLCDTCRHQHNLVLQERMEATGDTMGFRVETVPFFISGYWCPMTNRYADYAPCQSVFQDQRCTAIPESVTAFSQPCPDNELYDYDYVPARLVQKHQLNCCISWSELNDSSDVWSARVDEEIDRMIVNMGAALQHARVRQAISAGETVTVTIQGWTDSHPIDPTCRYTGNGMKFDGGIRLGRCERGKWLLGDSIAPNTPFGKSPAHGNAMLSTLRAYNMAVMLDRLWREKIPGYLLARDSDQIDLVVDGLAVKRGKGTDEQKRSVDVLVSVPHHDAQTEFPQQPTGTRDLRCCACGEGQQ